MPFNAYLNIKKILILYTEILRFYFFAARAAQFSFSAQILQVITQVIHFFSFIKKNDHSAIIPGVPGNFSGIKYFLPGNFSWVPGNFSGIKYFLSGNFSRATWQFFRGTWQFFRGQIFLTWLIKLYYYLVFGFCLRTD